MDNLICLDSIKLKNEIDIDKNIDFVENRNKEEFANVLGKVIDSGTNYIIKALPINDNFKDISICEQEKGKLFNYIKKILEIKRTEFQKTYTSDCFWNEILENEKANRKQVKEVKQIKTRKGKKNT